jgi:uncharacterized membrane-anchored protein YhcB (DUF1043 family)
MFDALFIIVPIFAGIIFILVIVMFISPKFRGKMMARQVKSMKYMLDESKEDLEAMGGTAINVKKNIIDDNEDSLKDLSRKEGEIAGIGIEKKARAVRKGLLEGEMYCKHCGREIDTDSKFCKHCGKEQ